MPVIIGSLQKDYALQDVMAGLYLFVAFCSTSRLALHDLLLLSCLVLLLRLFPAHPLAHLVRMNACNG